MLRWGGFGRHTPAHTAEARSIWRRLETALLSVRNGHNQAYCATTAGDSLSERQASILTEGTPLKTAKFW